MKIVLLILGVVITVLVGAIAIAGLRWDAATKTKVSQLKSAASKHSTSQPLMTELTQLPAPVQRYLSIVLGKDSARNRFARIEHAGEFLLKAPNGWRGFRSTQYMATHPPGFVWDARIRMAPGLAVRVRDALIAGRGSMLGRVAALVPVVDVKGTPDIASGALHRYLAEAVWVPMALLPSAGVQWSALDDSTARATLGGGTTSVSLDFHFGSDGLVDRVFTPARMRDVAGRGVPTPWEGRFTHYETRDGFLIPMKAEVAWLLPSGRQTYWRGRIITVEYQKQSRPE